MKYFFKQYEKHPLVVAGYGYYQFAIRNGYAELADNDLDQQQAAEAIGGVKAAEVKQAKKGGKK